MEKNAYKWAVLLIFASSMMSDILLNKIFFGLKFFFFNGSPKA